MKNRRKLALILLFSGVLVIAVSVTFYFLSDRQKFMSEEKDVNNFIATLKQENDIGGVRTDKYCNYSNQKFSKGSLVCVIDYTFKTPGTSKAILTVNDRRETLKWVYKGDNTQSTNEYSDIKYLKHEVFLSRDLTCLVSVREDGELYLHEINCSGPARAAWFPVKD